MLLCSLGLTFVQYCPVWARGQCRISPPHFLAECCKRQLNQVSFVVLYFRLSTFFDLYWVYLYFPVLFCLSVSVKWLAVKTASEMTYTVSSGALNSTPSIHFVQQATALTNSNNADRPYKFDVKSTKTAVKHMTNHNISSAYLQSTTYVHLPFVTQLFKTIIIFRLDINL